MLKPNEDQIRAMLNLRGDPSFDVFIQWIKKSLIAQSIANNRASGEMAIKNAGRNLELEEILDHINRAPDYLMNIKMADPKQPK